MNKKIGGLGLLFFVLLLMPIVFAVEIKIITKPERDVVVSVLDGNGDSIESFSNKTGDDGIVLFDHETTNSKIDINVIVRNNGKFEYGGPQKFEDQKTIRTIVIDLEPPEPVVETPVEEPVVETPVEEPVVETPVEEELLVDEPEVEEPVIEETVETPVEEETAEKVTGAAVTEDIKSFLSKTVAYIVMIAIVAVAVLVFIFRKKIGKKGSSGFTVKKMSDMKKEDKKAPPKDPEDYDKRLEDAEEKLKEAKDELDELKERKRKLREIRERYEKDKEELKELGEID